eukprot:CAMPEP_0185597712 /NCGR_PEP_ID=MMETSP0434-20130131/81545_1 /TAXON_ID=626734 ORGANISM="Favella taraikaensis, Strain Fe Narragansett Bay" /NCGR_SAMPLE_ID=MMETSP0434 /ASSEMBLY_ACC=CAM_ASM_000379 /LENGTH=73 /DNA_ID=CAMNT_0028226517 /DNA_START=1727 /DNA_END=1948 /DNA_ORIENTATION=-
MDFAVHMGSRKKEGKNSSVVLAETRASRESLKNSKTTKTQTAHTAVDAVMTPGTTTDQKTARSFAQTDRSKAM